MSTSASSETIQLDGVDANALAQELGVPRVVLLHSVTSTLDLAHQLGAAGAPAGTVIVADEQTAGRGRLGRRWTSQAGAGLWLTVVERPVSASVLDVLALRVGLYAAEALDELADAPVRVKWPNDLQVDGRKLAGVLIETRWRGGAAEWVAIGFGMNVVDPGLETSTGLRDGSTRLAALRRVVPAIRRAVARDGYLTADELARWSARDALRGQTITLPDAGIVEGITASGELCVQSEGRATTFRSGTVTLAAAT